ncbi:hypothetical protein GOV13_03525 [Candidatus Pacearchaeota archaeon]|nr:hypothetical protein [Candidatus Pacearchaeota archaeon]
MVKEKRFSKENIERSLKLAEKNMESGKPLRAKRALTAALNYARGYTGPGRKNYLAKVEESAVKLGGEVYGPQFDTDEYQDVHDIEQFSRHLRLGLSVERGYLPAIIGTAGLITGLFFLSPNITGNVISTLTNSTSNMIGLVLIVIGLIGAFFFFNSKKQR